MGTRQSQEQQEEIWIANGELARSPGHPFYQRLNELLDAEKFDLFVEGLCRKFYAPRMGRPSLAPGIYFRALLIGYFEGIDSERGIAWRLADSLALRQFVRISLTESTPDHSTISRTRRLIDVETHREVFGWVLGLLADRGLLKGKRVGVDATTLEASAAMRSIVRRDTGESYEEFLTGLAKASGIATPTREQLARLDRKRKKRTSNKEWMSPTDTDARVTKMKDGRTHLAHKAEHAVDLDTGAVVAVTLREADKGDTTTLDRTLCEAGETVAELVGREAVLHPRRQAEGQHQGHRRDGGRQGIPLRRGAGAGKELPGAQLHSGAAAERAAQMGGQGRPATGGVRQPAAGPGQLRQELAATAGRVGRTQLRALLRHRRHAAHASAQTHQHPQAAVDPCGRIQPEPDLSQVVGRRDAARVEQPGQNAVVVLVGPVHPPTGAQPALPKHDSQIANNASRSKRFVTYTTGC